MEKCLECNHELEYVYNEKKSYFKCINPSCSKRGKPLCLECQKIMSYNNLLERFECEDPLCYLKKTPREVWNEISNPICEQMHARPSIPEIVVKNTFTAIVKTVKKIFD